MKQENLLKRACRNHHGYFDTSPGTDMAGKLEHVSKSTIQRYINNGWLDKRGSGLILTSAGYDEI